MNTTPNTSKTITYEFIAYTGSIFKDVNDNFIEYEDIKDNFYSLDGRKGKIISKGYTQVIEHGFVGGYYSYQFVFQDDLSSVDLKQKIILKYEKNTDKDNFN